MTRHNWLQIASLSFLLLSATMLASAQSVGARSSKSEVDFDGLFAKLDSVDFLTGYAPSPTLATRHLNAIYCSSNAVDEFVRLYLLSSPEGKVLVLAALWQKDHNLYIELRGDFETTQVPARRVAMGYIEIGENEFDVMDGSCSPTRMSKADVLRKLDDGTLSRIVTYGCP